MLKESMLKKSISVGEVLAIAMTVLGVAIGFYTTTNIRLSALELRVTTTEIENRDYKQKQEAYQLRMENKLDGIKDDINNIKVNIKK